MIRSIKIIAIIFMFSFFENNLSANYEKLAYDFNFNKINGESFSLKDFKGKVIVVINVASKCGFTNQYNDMQKIWNKYKEKEFVLIGVPSNDFGGQEPGSNEEIKNFCESNFGISFPIVEKISVKGDDAHPFYLWAKKNFGRAAVPKWNFHKIIIDKSGKVAKTFSSITNPSSEKFIKSIEELL